MEPSNAHCSEAQLSNYARRALAWREVLQIDRHLQQCRACADRLSQRTEFRRARALLRPLIREEAHLSYEQIEALAEGKGALTAALEAHLQRCRMCRGELDDLKSFAGSFHLRPADVERPGVWDSIRQWFAQPLRLSATAVAGVAAVAIGVGLLSQGGLNVKGGAVAITSTSSSLGHSTARSLLFEDCGERELAAGSPEWLNLYRRGDYNGLATALKPPAEQGNRAAQTALGLLSAAGLGTERNLTTARAWLGRAAAQGDACAQRTLSSLQ
jgi:anti-sigma factor ChrR (cupin superfamily)